jgi:hypothetical protein
VFALGNIGPDTKEAVPALVTVRESDGDLAVRFAASDGIRVLSDEAKCSWVVL